MKRRQLSNDGVHWVDAVPDLQGPGVVLMGMHRYERVVDDDPETPDRQGVACPLCRQTMKYTADAKGGEAVAITCGTPGCMFNAPMAVDPKLGEVIAAARRSMEEALVPHLGPRLARVAVHGAGEHPAPWRWCEDLESNAWILYDAKMNVVMRSSRGRDEASPSVRALTEAAPDLEDRLLRCVQVLGLMTAAPELADQYRGRSIEAQAHANALLAQIKERSGG